MAKRPLFEELAWIKDIRAKIGEPRTDRQHLWLERVTNTELAVETALLAQDEALAEPGDVLLARQALFKEAPARKQLATVRNGLATHQRIYDEAHGGTVEERRAGWNAAYREVRARKGHSVRTNKKRSDMTAAQWEDHQREQRRLKRQKYLAKKKSP